MRYIACAIVALGMPAVVVSSWVNFPLSSDLQGWRFGIGAYPGPHPARSVLSIGILSALVLAIAAAAFFWHARVIACWAGAALLLLVLTAYLKVALGDPILLHRLADEADWRKWAEAFARKYLSPYFGGEPTQWSLLSFDTVGDRLVSGWYFMGLGWYLALAAAIMLFVSTVGKTERHLRNLILMTTGLGAAAASAAFAAGPLLAQHAILAAARAQAHGNFDAAAADYRYAITRDSWLALDPGWYQRLGAIDSANGRTWSPAFHVFRAEEFVRRHQIPEAISEYDSLLVRDSPVSALARLRSVQLSNDYGLVLYEGGAFGAAVETWQRALLRDPTNWLSVFYLSEGLFAVGRYQEAVSLINDYAARSHDPIFLSIIYCNLGDSSTMLGNYDDAHRAYSRSYQFEFLKNPRGLKSLIGP